MLLLTVLCSGCPRPLWLPDRNLKTLVDRNDILGKWCITSNSLTLLKRDGFVTQAHNIYAIDFRSDGSLEFQSVLAGFYTGTYCQVRGTWELKHDVEACSNVRSKNAIEMSLVMPKGTHFYCLAFDRDKNGLILWEYYGDPDSWEFVEYRKAEPAH